VAVVEAGRMEPMAVRGDGVDEDAADIERVQQVEVHNLLEEWLLWWRDAPEAPAKMPHALHIRTLMTLIEYSDEVGRQRIYDEFGGGESMVEVIDVDMMSDGRATSQT
jgi:hypothetical protein